MNIDFTSPQTQADPYPLFRYLRQNHPVYHTKWPLVGNAVVISRYADIDLIFKDPRFINNDRNLGNGKGTFDKWWTPKLMKLFRDSMAMQDDPEHHRLRTLVHQAFTPKRIRQIEARIQTVTTELLDAAILKGEMELITEFALPLPITIISEMLGIPETDRFKFHDWTSRIIDPTASMLAGVTMFANSQRIINLFTRLIKERRQQPQDDLISALAQANQGGDHLSEQELLAMLFLLLFAGHETTVNLIGNGILALLDHPEQLQHLRDEPQLIETAVEEILRFTNPTQHVATRFPTEDVELSGERIKRGTPIVPLIGAANRDETIFANSDAFDIGRTPNKHLGFGFGIHYCLGAPLARLEGKIAVQALVQRLPNLKLAIPRTDVAWRGSIALRGVKALPVTF